jgi:hypothetical protein
LDLPEANNLPGSTCLIRLHLERTKVTNVRIDLVQPTIATQEKLGKYNRLETSGLFVSELSFDDRGRWAATAEHGR